MPHSFDTNSTSASKSPESPAPARVAAADPRATKIAPVSASQTIARRSILHPSAVNRYMPAILSLTARALCKLILLARFGLSAFPSCAAGWLALCCRSRWRFAVKRFECSNHIRGVGRVRPPHVPGMPVVSSGATGGGSHFGQLGGVDRRPGRLNRPRGATILGSLPTSARVKRSEGSLGWQHPSRAVQ